MSVSYDIAGVGGTAVDVNVEPVTQASLVWLGQTENKAKTGVTQSYVLNTTDRSAPLQVHVYSAREKATGGKDVQKITWTLTSFVRATDSVTGLDPAKDQPISVTISMSIPFGTTVDVADLDKMLANAYSLTYPSATLGTRSTAHVSQLLLGGTKLY